MTTTATNFTRFACIGVLLFGCSGCKDNGETSQNAGTSKTLADVGVGTEPIEIHYSYDKYDSKTGWIIKTGAGSVIAKADRIGEPVKGVFIFRVSAQRRFEFDGGSLLQYETALQYITTDKTTTKYNKFAQWRCDFEYGNPSLEFAGIPDSATSLTQDGRSVAKARFRGLVKSSANNQVIGVEVEETHLNSGGGIVFRGISQYEMPSGFKRIEQRLQGQKRTEYFPVWPACP